MTQARTASPTKILAGVVLALTLVPLLAGCGGGGSEEKTPVSDTAKGSLSVAESALSTMAPDAKLLVVQSAETLTATSTPVWAYLFGSPKDDKTYVVYVTKGKVMTASEYGAAGLKEDDWKKVPGVDDWKIDSDEAYDKALAVSGATGDPAGHGLGMVTYVPSSETTPTTKAFTWYVSIDPGESGATTSTIQVDAKTGKASVVE